MAEKSNPLTDFFATLYSGKAYGAQATTARAQATGRANSLRSQANASRRQARDVANVAGRNMMAARTNQTRALSEVRAAGGRSGIVSTAGTANMAENALREATDREIDNLARQTSAQMGSLYSQAFSLDNQAATEEFLGTAQARYYQQQAKASKTSAWMQGIGMALQMSAGAMDGASRASAYNDAVRVNNPGLSEQQLKSMFANPYKAALFGGGYGLMRPTDMSAGLFQRLLTATPAGTNLYGATSPK